MAIKSISTRAQICGRSANCHGGHSAVEQSSYISREKMYSEYDEKMYYPKYSEDLVHCEVMLPENAPPEYSDPYVLWNSVENNEKGSNAQLARTYRIELPNEWSYELATEIVRDYVNRNFVSKGMCAQFAIHDSENKKTGQRNLHCHILLTMRGIDEQGHWMPKQKKVYLTGESGERIPLIDKATGMQKVDKQNRKQWKCATIQTNDWNSRENASIWRKDLVDIINSVNERLGMTENYWEYRSFKERGLDIFPQIHMGEKASALERAGIKTVRGDINRDIITKNTIIISARTAYEKAKENLEVVKAIPVTVARAIKNEILDMIRMVAERYNNRLKLPIIKGRYIGRISGRDRLQDRKFMEAYVREKGWSSYDQVENVKKELEPKFDRNYALLTEKTSRIKYLERLLSAYKDYEPYIKFNKEKWELRGWKQKQYCKKHIVELAYYDTYRENLKNMIKEPDKSITPGKWKAELEKLYDQYDRIEESMSGITWDLAVIEVLRWNKFDLDRILQNETKQLVHSPSIHQDIDR